jgi:RimJ/RimL family protein N-acetyltransferase
MIIECPRIMLRLWRRGDEAALVRHANNRNVWRNLRDHFPHPYTMADAIDWIRSVEETEGPARRFAIVREGEPIGGAGFEPFTDVHRRVAEIGYWLGEAHWGKGYGTEAVCALTDYAFRTFDLERMEAGVFAWNPASCRVLEKAGYRFEARIERSVLKDGETIDRLLYARFRDAPSA